MENEIMEKRKNTILAFIKDNQYTPMKPREMEVILGVNSNDKILFEDLIQELESEGRLLVTRRGKIVTLDSQNLIRGRFQSNAKGFGFVVPDDSGYSDIFIPVESVNGAMLKDTVLCRIISMAGKKTRAEGEIVKIVKRGLNGIVGTFERGKNFSFIHPDDNKIPTDIYIAKANTLSAVNGHKVVVKIIKPASEKNKNPEGKVMEILGHINDPGIDILSIVKQFDLPVSFNDKVKEEAAAAPQSIEGTNIGKRLDLTPLPTVTIDSDDAKDLDDAITIEKLENGYRLGVHIADVTHYVRENTALDKEALRRGTSVYLVDRVIPMLPFELSNGICSLNAGEPRLALSCIMDIDAEGNVVSHKIAETVINIDKRLSYDGVCAVLDKGEMDITYEPFINMLKIMDELRKILNRNRMQRGSIEFGFAETKIILNEEGVPLEIVPRVRNAATDMIEEFMLICNQTVAEEYFWLEAPFVYRSHEEPDGEKREKLADFVHHFGYSLRGKSSQPKNIQKLLNYFEGKPEQMIIGKVVLRSLKQARYTYENQGHFGLAAKYYCHFTSPIRRYPDLQIHRIIKDNLNGRLEQRVSRYNKILPEICRMCSISERTAEEAERETVNLKKVQYMKDKVGMRFDGVISSVTNWGLYVELPNTVEGMVALSEMDDDYYIFDEKNLQVIGEHLGKVYKLGQLVTVVLMAADEENRRLDFMLDEDNE